jgi:hypothetical protein
MLARSPKQRALDLDDQQCRVILSLDAGLLDVIAEIVILANDAASRAQLWDMFLTQLRDAQAPTHAELVKVAVAAVFDAFADASTLNETLLPMQLSKRMAVGLEFPTPKPLPMAVMMAPTPCALRLLNGHLWTRLATSGWS